MPDHEAQRSSTTEGLPVAPSLGPGLAAAHIGRHPAGLTARALLVTGLAVLVAFVAAGAAQVLTKLINLFTNLAFFGRLSLAPSSPADNHLGFLVLVVPVLGAILVGLLARYGSKAIRGHGIPEAMEQILMNESRIPPRLTFLKPLSAAVAIGTGGPFGAEGPIIATGGALGSLLGQVVRTTAVERKTLLAAGAAAGMAATFGSPVSAVLLAIELLLFEYRPRSLIPVIMAASTATGVRFVLHGSAPAFGSTPITEPGGVALALYVLLGALLGVAAVLATRAVYAIEDAFERLPLHWMWWPALGALPVCIIGYFAPRTLGVGYDNIEGILRGDLLGASLAMLCGMKFLSWAIALGSGTSGGTLAPLFTVGGALGALLGQGLAALLPSAGVDPRLAALIGMAAIFAGASRALLASVVFAFETTRQPLGLLPLLAASAASFLVSAALMRHSIMTEKIVRRGRLVPSELGADPLAHTLVAALASRPPAVVSASATLAEVRHWLGSGAAATRHQGFPVVDERGQVLGVLTRRELEDAQNPPTLAARVLIQRPVIAVAETQTAREAADLMAEHGVGRLPVFSAAVPPALVGMVTRSDLLRSHERRLREERMEEARQP